MNIETPTAVTDPVKNADADKVYGMQRKFIWPVAAVMLIVAAFLFGMKQGSNQDCLEAVNNMDAAIASFEMARGNSGSGTEFWTGSGNDLMYEYGVDAAACRGE